LAALGALAVIILWLGFLPRIFLHTARASLMPVERALTEQAQPAPAAAALITAGEGQRTP